MTVDPLVVGGRYELSGTLGRGGMAEVRRAVDRRLGRPVAVKQLRADLATDPTFQARFRREAQSAAGLNHPTIVAVYDTGEETDPRTGISIPYIVMELVEGPTLRDVLRDGRKILPERALELTQGVLDALSYSHKAGIIHRDIKPANVMLTPTGGVKVMDFGIARAVADTSATMTQTAAVIGTAQYLSPEQARGETVDARSDIYSAGCLLYELLVGRPPFIGESPVSVAYQHVREAPIPPSQLDPVISADIDAVTLKALAKDAGDRYQSAREMKADIARVLAGQQATAVVPRVADLPPARAYDNPTRVVPPPHVVTPSQYEEEGAEDDAPPKRRVGLAVLITVLAIVVLVGGGYALYRAFVPANPVIAQVEVPNVLTYTEQQAADQLTARGLKIEVKRENGEEETKGTATGQNPIGGTQVAVDSTVSVTINDGPKTGTIPNGLVGDQVDDVVQELEDAGFTNVGKTAAKTEDSDAKENEVLNVNPKPGATANLDAKVTVTYATGKSEVPNFDGMDQDRALDAASEAGFPKPQFVEEVTDQGLPGTVISQDPKAGAKADRDTQIKLTIARAPVASPTPEPSETNTPKPSVTPGASATPGG
ncbi:MAG TPA: Stk1 family PASTA domain-containing Ser/Thr kinase [Propionibacteriaceae bacterium]